MLSTITEEKIIFRQVRNTNGGLIWEGLVIDSGNETESDKVRKDLLEAINIRNKMFDPEYHMGMDKLFQKGITLDKVKKILEEKVKQLKGNIDRCKQQADKADNAELKIAWKNRQQNYIEKCSQWQVILDVIEGKQ